MSIRALLEIKKVLERIEGKMDGFVKAFSQRTSVLDLDPLLRLPGHLQKTYIALYQLGTSATASDVARVTKKARAVESGYLNQLVHLGYVTRTIKQRKVWFTRKVQQS